ncbi:MAG: Tat pathway signal protein [Caulobacteraceae bacterium]|nr:Tat pathway signal protein [Caulobacteraceae bacterium]
MDRRLIVAATLLAPTLVTGVAQASEGKERKKGGGANFVQIPTLTASLLKADNRRGVLTVEAGVDTPSPALRARVASLQPRLRDGYNAYLARFAAALRPGFVPDADLLARELQGLTDRIAGRGCRLLLGTILIN